MSEVNLSTEADPAPSEEAIIVIVSEDGSGEVAVDRHLLQQILGSSETAMLNVAPDAESEATESKPEEEVTTHEENVNMPEEEFNQAEPMDILEDEEKMQVEPIGPMSEQINSLLNLDEEEIKKIEHALQSQEADEILGDTFQSMLEPEAELDDLLDPELTGVPDHVAMDDDGQVPQMPVSLEEDNSGIDTDSSSTAATLTSGRSVSPKRRSQRQIDRLEREQLEKIRAENEQMLKKEKETMLKKDEDIIEKPEVTTNEKPVSRLSAIRQEMQQKILVVEPLKKPQTPSLKGKLLVVDDQVGLEVARPKRERKVPKHLREAFEEFEGTPEYLRKLMNSNAVQEAQPSGDSNSEAGTRPKKNPEEVRVKKTNSVNKETKTKDESDNGKAEEDAGDNGDEEEDDDDNDHSGESWNSDDDPDKLWCVCRKPHNNRFMICCDKCEDWFHGHCVGVTRTMGREMEENGLEWICPRCVKQEARGGKAESPGTKADSPEEKPGKTETPQTKKVDLKVDIGKAKAQLEKRKERSASQGEETGRKCVIASCRNMARASSIYCSDVCIIAHARDSLALISKEKAKHEKPDLTVAPPTPKSEPIKLKESTAFSKLMSQVTPSPTRSKSIVTGQKPISLPDDFHVTVMDRKTGKILKDSQAPKAADLEAWLKKNPTYEVVKPGISPGKFYKPTQRSTPATPTTTPPIAQQRKRKQSVELKEEKSLPDPEVMRNSARISLKEALWNRCKELAESKVTEEDVAKVAEEIESALYRHFNKDVGTKYKAKYRSLLFNIKDVKNQGLFRKIAERQIKPRDLVKMTAEELASKELAEWREREAKHQLDIIKKTELELVTMSKKYNVVKTHKGEEIIEEVGDSKADEKGIVVEPVMEILQGTSKSDQEKESKEKKDKHKEKEKHKHSKDKDRHRRESSSSSSKHRKKDKERDRDKKHDKDRDKEKERNKDKERSKEENGRKEREKEKERERRHSHKHKDSDKSKKEEETKREEPKLEMKEEEKPQVKEEPPKTNERKEEEKDPKEEIVVEEQEPTSTVTIKTPEIESSPPVQVPLWKGVLNSSDVGKFSVLAYEMAPNVDMSDTLTKDTLDIVGRIPPQVVWDYIMQTRKVGTREVVVIHIQPQVDSDRKFYNAFLSHMYKTNRYAVVGPVSKLVKDFYIVPLPKDSPIPTSLTALVPDSPVLDENRTSVLIGLIVRSKKGHVTEVREKHHKHAKKSSPVIQPTSKAEDAVAYIPTSKSTTKKRSHEEVRRSAKKAKVDEDDDDDIPYSPSQLLEEEEGSKLDQQQAILEELNHKIEQQKNELISMTSKLSPQEVETLIPGLEPVIPGLEPTDSISRPHVQESSSTGLTNISIPNNLQEILSAIQKKEEELTRLSQIVEHGTGDVDLRATLPALPSGDVDMRMMPNPSAQQESSGSMRRDPRRKSLNQLTDEELLAKAMEMESSINNLPTAVQEPQHAPYYPGPPQMMRPGPPRPMGPMPPMMVPRPPPYGPGFVPARGPPFGQPAPYWGPPGARHARGPRPR